MTPEQIAISAAQITSLLLQLLKTRRGAKELAIIQEIQANHVKIYSYVLDLSQKQDHAGAELQKLAANYEALKMEFSAQLEQIRLKQEEGPRWG